MGRIPFLERLEQDKPLLADGAMGTMLHQAGVRIGSCLDALNVQEPSIVAKVHRQYLEAGAELIETNTFGANEFKLAQYGLQEQTIEFNKAGVELAQRVIDASFREDVYLGGSVGPLGVWIAPIGRVSEERAYQAFRKQISTLIYKGVDVIILETFSDADEISLAVHAARDVKATIPIIAQITFTRDDRTVLGDTAATIAERLVESGADVIGVNCSSGPAQLLRIIGIIRTVAPHMKLSVQPNAGWPEHVGGRVMYHASADYFGEYALAFADVGVSVIGGCCGTTPVHIKAMRDALDDTSRPHAQFISIPKPEAILIEAPLEQPTRLQQKLEAGEFVTTVELAPPRSFTAQRVIAAAEMLRDAGVTFINVSDSPLARMRMSPWAVAYLIQERVGIETILHFPVKGRNLLRVQGDLLAAYAMNIRNIFVTMGDPSKIGDYPESFDTHDVVPTGLINLLHNRFNQGVDQAGNSIGQPTHFTAGAALNMNPTDLHKEIELTRKKIQNGADFFLTQPIFDPPKAREFLTAYEDEYREGIQVPILAGLLPLNNPRHAAFLHNEVPGISIPEVLRQRIDHAEDPAAEGVKIAQELLLEVKTFLQGAYIMPPFGKYYLAAEVVEVLQPDKIVG
jgi:homocysteine S-methyltransferase